MHCKADVTRTELYGASVYCRSELKSDGSAASEPKTRIYRKRRIDESLMQFFRLILIGYFVK
jgi:hypothetical protein